MELAPGVTIDDDVLAVFCRANGVRRPWPVRLSASSELRPDSDIDLLVEFEPGRVPGLLQLATLDWNWRSYSGGRSTFAPRAT